MQVFTALTTFVWLAGVGAIALAQADRAAPRPWLPAGRIVDLTHTFDERTIFWPTEPGFKLEQVTAGITAKGYYYAANRFSTAEHGGTHLDAPIHFFRERSTVDRLPLERLVGEGAVVDVAQACADDADYEITVADLRAWEERNRRLLVDVILLLRTGYARHWGERAKYLGTAEQGPAAVAKLHFPGLAPQAARWLVEHRQVKAVGIDTASIDPGQTERFAAHVALSERNIPIFENVDLSSALPAQGFTVIALPMKIGGGTGGPLRIIAIVPE